MKRETVIMRDGIEKALMERNITWLSPNEVTVIAPGLSESRLRRLQLTGAGPDEWQLSDGSSLYDELNFRRWLESTVDEVWVYGPPMARLPLPPKAREYRYGDATLDELRRRTYITKEQLVLLLPGLTPYKAQQMRSSGSGPRFLRPTPNTIIYVAEEAVWWASEVPSLSWAHEVGYTRQGEVRPKLTPPVGIDVPLTEMELSRIRLQ